MTLAVSVYLDLVRTSAALVVFLAHLLGGAPTAGAFPQASSLGPEAVVAFFVISGFVIAYVADTREATPSDYAINRLSRIYSVALPAIAVTLIADSFGRYYVAGYDNTPPRASGEMLSELAGCLLFVNELWDLHMVVGSNGPYWSLGFEVPYYVLFALVLFLNGKPRMVAVCLWLAAAGPRIVLGLPIWLLGCATYNICKKRIDAPRAGAALLIAVFLLYLPFHLALGQPFPLYYPLRFEIVTVQGCGYFYLLAFLMSVTIVGVAALSRSLHVVAERIGPTVRWLAGLSFTLYLMHLPIATLLSVICPWPRGSLSAALFVLCGTLLAMIPLAAIGEHRKAWWRKLTASALFAVTHTLAARRTRFAPD